MDNFDFNAPSTNFASPMSEGSQGSFDAQPLQDFNFGAENNNNNNNQGFDFGGSAPSFDFNSNAGFSTDPNDFLQSSTPIADNASGLPENIFPSSGGFNEQNFSLNPSDFIASSGNENFNIDNSQQLYPPSLETPLDFVPEEKPINDTFFADSPKVEGSAMGSFGKNEESPKSSPYQSLSSEFSGSGSVFQEKNPVLREYELEHEKFLNEKSELERKKKEEVLNLAANELKKFYKDKDERIAKMREENSQKAQHVVAVPEDDKQAWINLEELIDWKCAKEVKEDTTRLRSILITMKHA